MLLSGSYLALRMKKYEMTLREYLCEHRNPDELKQILFSMIEGVRQLHQMGYVHRDLKPENVMINFSPIHTTVIDFNRAIRQENVSTAMVLGTPGYFPIREKWISGSI